MIKRGIVQLVNVLVFGLMISSCGSYTVNTQVPPSSLEGVGHIVVPHFDPDKPANRKGISYLSCDYGFYMSSHSGPHIFPYAYRKAAYENYIYALMSVNSYRNITDLQFRIPGWQRIERWESENGLGFDVYKSDQTKEVVIAFRGTEGNDFKDFYAANFSIFFHGQYKNAYEAVVRIKSALPQGYKLTVTGHSLGGGLATNASLRVGGVNSIVFNTSPRFMFGNVTNINQQVFIDEKGEALSIVRSFWRSFTILAGWGKYNGDRYNDGKKIEYYAEQNHFEYNFLNFNQPSKTFREHSSYYQARGLLIAAMAHVQDSPGELNNNIVDPFEVFRSNITKPVSGEGGYINGHEKCALIFD